MQKILGILLISLTLFFPSQVQALDTWTKKDTARELIYAAIHVIDWGQTRSVAKTPDRFWERNSILGRHPSLGKVDTYFMSTLIGHVAMSYVLPNKYRIWWQYISIGVQGAVVAHNYNIGLKVDF